MSFSLSTIRRIRKRAWIITLIYLGGMNVLTVYALGFLEAEGVASVIPILEVLLFAFVIILLIRLHDILSAKQFKKDIEIKIISLVFGILGVTNLLYVFLTPELASNPLSVITISFSVAMWTAAIGLWLKRSFGFYLAMYFLIIDALFSIYLIRDVPVVDRFLEAQCMVMIQSPEAFEQDVLESEKKACENLLLSYQTEKAFFAVSLARDLALMTALTLPGSLRTLGMPADYFVKPVKKIG